MKATVLRHTLTTLTALLWVPLARLDAAPVAPDAREFLSLDGVWQIVFDRANQGGAEHWSREKNFPTERQQEITVPSCWELVEQDYEGVAFYRRTFELPKRWQGRVVRLQFDAVNFRAEVWLNDTAVGFHEGGFTPFAFRVDDLLRFDGENTLILRVVGPILIQEKRVDDLGPMETPQWRGAITGGIWQPVRLIATGDVQVRDVFLEPKLPDDTATFHTELEHVGERAIPVRVEITIRSGEQTVAQTSETLSLKPGVTQRNWTLKVPGATHWSPDNPHLYSVDMRVSCADRPSDRWTTRFGMREFTIRDNQFYLNGKPLYLKAAFFEGLYPVQLAYPDSRQMVVREIQLAKDAGFNMIRPWRKPPPPMWLDLADELGVLTVGSLVVECMDFPVDSARLSSWVENEVRESILRDRNRTCVVQWELFNEITDRQPYLKRLLRPMSVLARQLDPTRLILDESGGWTQGANIVLPYESQPTKFNDIHDYPGPQINEEVYTKLLLTGSKTHEAMRAMGLGGRLPGKNVQPGLMSFFSELGYGSLPDLVDNNRRFAEIGNPIAPPTRYHRRLADEHRQALKESGFDTIYPDLKTFCLDQQQIHGTANQRMIEAVRCNPKVAGYCIHALVAGDWILGAGLLDMWRNPKTHAYEATKAASQPRILSIRVRPRNVYAEQGTRIEITGVNESEAIRALLKVQVLGDDGGIVVAKTVKAELRSGITQLFGEKLDTRALQGTHTIRAEIISDDGSPRVENTYSFDVFTTRQLSVPKQRIAVFDPGNTLKPFLRQSGMEFLEFAPGIDPILPVFVSRTAADTREQRNRFAELAAFIEAGGTAVYLQGGGTKAPWGVGGEASPLLPFHARLKQAIGLWNGIPHIVKDHPIFAGLPVNGMMGAIYENVWAETTLVEAAGETIVGAIGYDWFPNYELSQRHYYGPGHTWWGADLAVIPLGKGRGIVSQLRLVENLGRDPVADLLLFNMINWTTGEGG